MFLESILRGKQITFGDFLEKLEGIQRDGYGNRPVFFDCGATPTHFSCFLGSCYVYLVLKHTRLLDCSDHTVDALLLKGGDMTAVCLSIPFDVPLFADTDGRFIIDLQWQGKEGHWKILTAAGGITIPKGSLVSVS